MAHSQRSKRQRKKKKQYYLKLIPLYDVRPWNNKTMATDDDDGKEKKAINIPWWAVVIAAAVITFVLFAVDLRLYKDPEFRVETAIVTSASQLVANGSELTASWDVTLTAVNLNDNDVGIYFHYLQATAILYQPGISTLDEQNQVMLATKRVPPPLPLDNQRSHTRIKFQLETELAYLGDDVAKRINDGSSSSVRLGLNLLVRFTCSTMKSGWASQFTDLGRYFCGFAGLLDHQHHHVSKKCGIDGIAAKYIG